MKLDVVVTQKVNVPSAANFTRLKNVS